MSDIERNISTQILSNVGLIESPLKLLSSTKSINLTVSSSSRNNSNNAYLKLNHTYSTEFLQHCLTFLPFIFYRMCICEVSYEYICVSVKNLICMR